MDTANTERAIIKIEIGIIAATLGDHRATPEIKFIRRCGGRNYYAYGERLVAVRPGGTVEDLGLTATVDHISA